MGAPAGLKDDCEALLSRFQEMDSVRFEDFTELWRSMKFGTIFWWVFLVPPLSVQGRRNKFLPSLSLCGTWEGLSKVAV